MDRDRCRKEDEEKTEEPMLGDKYRTIEKGDPDHAYRDDLDLKRYGPVDHEIGDIWPKTWMIEKPVVKSSVATQEKCSGKEKQGGGRKHRKKYPQDSESQGYHSEYCKKPPHMQMASLM